MLRREIKEREEQARKHAEMTKQVQQNSAPLSKAAPWSQSNTTMGTSLEEIQKAERQKRAEQVALLQQQRERLQMQQVSHTLKITN